ncbi:LOB domain-containing protein 18-like [Zingiber officinale]|uniref:LOB domain-containing protein 18-like n=1 Tax=Zingiber officinale TaxID=94328 RepID=UPI001C4C9D0E|nr:LOB domain-containing protein 18-like [Zingiber officinale]
MSSGSSISAGAGAGAGSGGGSGAGSGGGGAGGGGPCGACKFLRRKCVTGCIFAPYFDSEQGAAHFAAVHKVFGASNASKLLLHIPAHKRLDAVVTIFYEAQARLRDPVYGCVTHIFALQQQVCNILYTYMILLIINFFSSIDRS